MDFEIFDLESKEVFGISILLTSSQTENYKIISSHWRYFNKKLKTVKRNNKKNWEKFGLTLKKNGNYFYVPTVPNVESGYFEKHIIQFGKYLKFQHMGDMKNLKVTVHNIYKKVLPESNLRLDIDRTILHFERYDYRFKWNRKDSVIDIYVPIKN